jgi:outer membrane beta-barrel protein
MLVASLLMPTICLAQLEELENPGSVSAVQPREVKMAHELNLAIGVLPLDAFYKGLYGQLSYTYHFTDYLAWQIGRGAFAYALRTGLRQELESKYTVLPTTTEEVQFFFGSDLILKPFYAKFTLANRTVVHGEIFFIVGPTVFKFTNVFRPAINLGGGVRVFISQWVSFRLDVTDAIVIPTGGGQTALLNVMTSTFALAVNFGATP